MPPKKTQRKCSSARRKAAAQRASDERAREDEERTEDTDNDARASDPEQGAAGGSESHEEGGGSKTTCSFSLQTEERLVEFFSVNPCFYDKSDANYMNQQRKDKLLDQLATELQTTRKQIQGWFKNMRSSVGKLFKTKSGQATQPLTARKKWQVENFTFLKSHIVPRTYTVDTTSLEETGEHSEDEGSRHSPTPRPASPSPTISVAGRRTKPPVSKKSKIDDLLMKFLDRPRPDEVLSKQLETIAAATTPAPQQPDERRAFSQWIAARMSDIPHDRWDDFQLDAMRLVQNYSKSRPYHDTTLPPIVQPTPRPVQQQWPHFPQQQQQWGQMQTWQQQWPQRQQQWGTSTQVQHPSQQGFQQASSSSQPPNQLFDAPVHSPAARQSQLGTPRSQSVPPLLDSPITGSGLTGMFMKQLTEDTSPVAALQTASPSLTQKDSDDE